MYGPLYQTYSETGAHFQHISQERRGPGNRKAFIDYSFSFKGFGTFQMKISSGDIIF